MLITYINYEEYKRQPQDKQAESAIARRRSSCRLRVLLLESGRASHSRSKIELVAELEYL